MKKLILILLLFITSFSYSQSLAELDKIRQQQVNDITVGGGPVTPEVVQFTNVQSVTEASEIVLTKPTGSSITNGDLLLLMVGSEDETNTITGNAVTGWTKAFEYGDSGEDVKLMLYWRIADGTEAATTTVTFATGTDHFLGWYVHITGNISSPIGIEGTVTKQGGASTITTSSITPITNNSLVFSWFGWDSAHGSVSVTSGTGWPASFPTDQYKESGGGTGGIESGFLTKNMDVAGATGDVVYTGTVLNGNVGLQFEILGQLAPEIPLFEDAIASSGTATPLTVDYPTTVADDDYMLMACLVADNSTFTTPTGWTLINNESNAGGFSYAVYGKVGVSGDSGGSVSLAVSSYSGVLAAVVYRFSGVATSTSYEGLDNVAINADVTPSLSITDATLGVRRLAVVMHIINEDFSYVDASTGYTQASSLTGVTGTDYYFVMDTQGIEDSGGNDGTSSKTIATFDPWRAAVGLYLIPK